HVAGTIYLDDAETGVLLVLGAKAAIMWAAVLGLRAECQRNCAGLVVSRERDIGICIAVHERHERPAPRAAFAHIDFVVAQKDFGIDDAPALRTNAPGQFVEHIVRIHAMPVGDFTRAGVATKAKGLLGIHAKCPDSSEPSS